MTRDEGHAPIEGVLSALSAVLPVGLVAVDVDGDVWYHNQRWENVTGVDEQAGRRWYDVLHPDDRTAMAARWDSGSARRNHLGPFRTVSTNGAVHDCLAESAAVQDPAGTLTGYVIVVRGVGGKERYGSLPGPHMVERLLDRSEDFVTILNPDGSWRWSSAGVLRLIGNGMAYDPADGVLPYLHPDDVPMVQDVFARVAGGGGEPGERVEVRIRAADGSWRHIEALLDDLLEDPDVRGLVVHARDVTERRALLDELAKIDTHKTAAMATVSHELRNPLTSIIGFAELLRDAIGPDGDAEQVGYVDTILRNARQVMRLSGDLVDLEHLTAGTVALSVGPVDVAECLRRAVHAMAPSAAPRGLALDADIVDGPTVTGDGERLGQLFDNLLSNAVKFTPPGGRVAVRGSPIDDGWQVDIADTGMGIPYDDVPHVFTQFFRASNAPDGRDGGRGLGLSIVKAIVDLHRGEIDVTSSLGAGTIFRVRVRDARP